MNDQLLEKAIKLSSLDEGRLSVLSEAIKNTSELEGEIWECGVWRGGSALYLALHTVKIIRLFDTFEGMPTKTKWDKHEINSMNETSYEEVEKLLENFNCTIHKGTIPETFKGLENKRISVAHIDVDNYESVKNCLEFIYPRTFEGGYIILDDYNCSSCPGAKKATDEFLKDKKEKLVKAEKDENPQAFLIKL